MTKPSASTAPEPLLDLPRLVMSIRRRRRSWLAAGLLGFLAGTLLALLVPPQPTAVARLLIVHEEDGGSVGDGLMLTDIAVLETTRIAGAALRKLNSTEDPEDFVRRYEGIPLTTNVLELKVRGTSDADAVARAKALADAFMADHVQRTRAGADAEATALTDQRDQTQAQLDEVEAAIAATPARATGDAATKRETLVTQRAELAAQIFDLGRRAELAAIGAPRVAAGTQVVDGPRADTSSLLVTVVRNGGVGLVLGLAIGLTLAAVGGVVQDRPVLRREIAEHLGASVIAQLPAPRRGPARLWRRSRAVAERQRAAATLVRTVGDGPGAVSVLELGCPRTAAALALDMAEKLAADGPVVLVDDLPGHDVGKLTGRRESPVRIEDGDGPSVPVWPGERRIGVGSVSPGTAWTDLERLGSETLLVVRAGHANTLWLHTVARQLADSQIPVIGVVLVHPDPRDRSDGTLWDGLHTALRGRAARGAGSTSAVATPSREERPARAGAVSRNDDPPTERFPPVRSAAPENGGPANVTLARRHRRKD